MCDIILTEVCNTCDKPELFCFEALVAIKAFSKAFASSFCYFKLKSLKHIHSYRIKQWIIAVLVKNFTQPVSKI